MEKKQMSKKTKTTVVALALTLVMALGGTAAYLTAASDKVTNDFTPQILKVDVDETEGTQVGEDPNEREFKIMPGTTDAKDPKVNLSSEDEESFVTNVDSYVYVIVSEANNTVNGKIIVQYDIADGWTELTDYTTKEFDVNGDGTPDVTIGDTDKVYYRTVTAEEAATASYSVLDGDQVTYNAALTSEDMSAITNEPTLKFQAYAVSQEGFDTALKAWEALATTKEAAKAAIEAELAKYPAEEGNEHGNDAQNTAAVNAKADIDAATDQAGIVTAKNDGIKAIQEAATPASTMPKKSDIIKINSKDYRVLSIDGSKAFLMSMADVSDGGSGMNYDADGNQSEKNLIQYKDSDIDNYLENTWYASLDNTMKDAIEATTIEQPAYEWTSTAPGSGDYYSGTYGFSTPSNYYIVPDSEKTAAVGSRHAYLLDVKDVVDYLGEGNLTPENVNKMFFNTDSTTSKFCWLRSAYSSDSIIAWDVRGDRGNLLDDGYYYNREARAAFTIDLSQVEFEKK